MTCLKLVGSCIDTNGGSEASLESCLNRALKAQKPIPLCQARTFTSRRSVSPQTHGLIGAANELGARAQFRKKHLSTDMAGLFNLEEGSRSGLLEGWSRPLLTHLGAYHHHKLWQSRFSVRVPSVETTPYRTDFKIWISKWQTSVCHWGVEEKRRLT